MKTARISTLVWAVLAAALCADTPPATKLYVKTVPAGARIYLDGKEVGRSDDLFVVAPGAHEVQAELADYRPESHKVDIAPERVTRLVIEFKRVQNAPASARAADEPMAAKPAGLPKELTLDLGKGVKMELVLIPAGSFMMGSPENEQDRDKDEGPPHPVKIAQPFYMGKYAVTNRQYRCFKPDHDSGEVQGGVSLNGDEQPVVNVNWNEAQAFCQWLSQKSGIAVALPSESRREYVMRGGDGRMFPWGSEWPPPQGAGNFADDAYKQKSNGLPMIEGYHDGFAVTAPAGSFRSNPFGVYDLSGNVWEWCEDVYRNGYFGAPSDGSAWELPSTRPAEIEHGQTARVLRGGCWHCDTRLRLRSAMRNCFSPSTRTSCLGFRVVVDVSGDAKVASASSAITPPVSALLTAVAPSPSPVRLIIPTPASLPAAADAPATTSASDFLRRADLPAATLEAMLTVIRQHPDETRWSGRQGTVLFGLVAKPLPRGSNRARATPTLLNLTHLLAVQELLKAGSLLDSYAKEGLTDATTLGQAVVLAAGKLQISGSVKSVRHGAAVEKGFAVAYVLAEERDLTAHLLQGPELEQVRATYREVMHGQARDLMKRGNFQDALLLWKHLHSRNLVSQNLYLDAAKCFTARNQNDDAIRVLAEACDVFAASAEADFFEQAGDLALAIETPEAQQLAEKAYQMASRKLLVTISPATQPAESGDNQF